MTGGTRTSGLERREQDAAGRRAGRVFAVLLGVAMLAGCTSVPPPPPRCVTDSPAPGTTVELCLLAPPAEARLVTDTTVQAELTVRAGAPRIEAVDFALGGVHVLRDPAPPYAWVLHPGLHPAGRRQLSAVVQFTGGAHTIPVSTSVVLAGARPPAPPPFRPPAIAPRADAPVVVAALGDGASGLDAQRRVVDLVAGWHPDLMLYLGDVYAEGTAEEFANNYDGTGTLFGRFRSRTAPTAGNHEYVLDGRAGPYHDYWGGVPPWYSFDIGDWHLVSIDDTREFAQLSPGSEQYRWLEADLAAHPGRCTLVFWHRPPFSVDTGEEGPGFHADLMPLWQLVARHRTTLTLAGHAHHYERWAPLDGEGRPSPDGTTSIVAGTGGQWISPTATHDPRLVAAADTTTSAWGALRLELWPDRAVVAFQAVKSGTQDTDEIGCHG